LKIYEERAPSPPDYGNVIPQILTDVELLDLLRIKCAGDLNIPPFKDFGCAAAPSVWPEL